jgi:hypothetical protein
MEHAAPILFGKILLESKGRLRDEAARVRCGLGDRSMGSCLPADGCGAFLVFWDLGALFLGMVSEQPATRR